MEKTKRVISVTVRFYVDNPQDEKVYRKVMDFKNIHNLSIGACIKAITSNYFQNMDYEDKDKELIWYLEKIKNDIISEIKRMGIVSKEEKQSFFESDGSIPDEVMACLDIEL